MRSDSATRRRRAALVAALALGFGSCADREPVLHPTFPDGGMLAHATPLAQAALDALAGMYQAGGDEGAIGGLVVVHPARGTLSIFSAVNDAYAVMHAGCIDGGTRVVLEGYWRFPATVDTGLIRLFVDQPDVALAACQGKPLPAPPTGVSLSGAWGTGDHLPDADMSVRYDHARVDAGDHFWVTSHHGACRTIDDCGASENSVESIRLVEALGSSAVELDVRITKDGVPILYHDDNFTPRLSKGPFCHGPVKDYSYAHVLTICTLMFGEHVPTLDEVLATAVDETTLRAMWLDMKVPEAVVPAVGVAAKYNALAKQKGRKFTAVIGLGDSATLGAYLAAQLPPTTPCLVELELDDVRRANCHLWGPRWTRGPMGSEVATMQAEGRGVVYWTIDDQGFVDLFLTEGKPNGMLSDRPGMVLQRFNVLGTIPPGSPVYP